MVIRHNPYPILFADILLPSRQIKVEIYKKKTKMNHHHHTTKSKKRLEEKETKLDKTTTEEFLPGFSQGRILGQGCFGAVYTFNLQPTEEKEKQQQRKLKSISEKLDQAQSPKQNMMFSLKVSSFKNDKEGRFLDSYLREVYFLRELRKLRTGLVPALFQDRRVIDETKADKGKGIQMMERYDGNAKQLGSMQATLLLGLNTDDNKTSIYAFTWFQLEQLMYLAKKLDAMGLIHGDFKLSNLLYRKFVINNKKVNNNNEIKYEFRVCDFGFSGYVDPTKSPYSPLNGFLGNFGCSTERVCTWKSDGKGGLVAQFQLKTPIPKLLQPIFNQCQLYVSLMECSRLCVFDASNHKNRMDKTNAIRKLLRENLGMTDAVLQSLYAYCPELKRCLPRSLRKKKHSKKHQQNSSSSSSSSPTYK
jgi:hypothetical protein